MSGWQRVFLDDHAVKLARFAQHPVPLWGKQKYRTGVYRHRTRRPDYLGQRIAGALHFQGSIGRAARPRRGVPTA